MLTDDGKWKHRLAIVGPEPDRLTDEQIQKLRDGKLSPGLERDGVIAELCTRLLSAEEENRRFKRYAWLNPDAYKRAAAERDALQARVKVLEDALRWYGEQARLAKLIHSEGDSGRNALAKDGGERARTALQEQGK
jgi:hypothetical protein